MKKRDRIAIVASLGWYVYLYFGFGTFFNDEVLVWMAPVALYWGYRFINKSVD